MYKDKDLLKISMIDTHEPVKVIEMNEKISQLIQLELAKMYSDENVAEYRYLSRLYSHLSSQIDISMQKRDRKSKRAKGKRK